jgi:hypothetical protein
MNIYDMMNIYDIMNIYEEILFVGIATSTI